MFPYRMNKQAWMWLTMIPILCHQMQLSHNLGKPLSLPLYLKIKALKYSMLYNIIVSVISRSRRLTLNTYLTVDLITNITKT